MRDETNCIHVAWRRSWQCCVSDGTTRAPQPRDVLSTIRSKAHGPTRARRLSVVSSRATTFRAAVRRASCAPRASPTHSATSSDSPTQAGKAHSPRTSRRTHCLCACSASASADGAGDERRVKRQGERRAQSRVPRVGLAAIVRACTCFVRGADAEAHVVWGCVVGV